MDAVVLHGSLKSHLRNPRKPFNGMPSDNFSRPHFPAAGVLPRHPISQSYPPYPNPQPPLLPLPATNPRRCAAAYVPPAAKKGNRIRTRDSSLTPKKSKSTEKEEEKSPKNETSNSITTPSGPDPKELPKDVARVLPPTSGTMNGNENNCSDIKYSGSAAFTISPPPSSLPLPTFFLRPKLSCAAVAGIDTGATDDLRRLLRLR